MRDNKLSRYNFIVKVSLLFFTLIMSSQLNAEEKISPQIDVDQTGYPVAQGKFAVIQSPVLLPFYLYETNSNKPVYQSMPHLAEASDAASGSSLWIADFSAVNVTGEYYITVPGKGKSYPFVISSSPYSELSLKAMKGFYYLRCGTPLDKNFAGVWERGICHAADAIITPPTVAKEEIRDVSGGWHEGGDLGKYTLSGAYATGLLLQAYEWFPNVFPDRSLQIPESGNGIPDILDEVKWEITWLLKMQEPSGGIAHKLTGENPVSDKAPQNDLNKRYLYAISTNATANACAVFAKASRLYSPFDATFSAECHEAAQNAWKFLELSTLKPGFTNPEGTLTQNFQDLDDTDEKLWAAVELYLTFKDTRFQKVINLMVEKRVPFVASSGYWGNVMPLAAAEVLSNTGEFPDTLKKDVLKDLVSLADALVAKSEKDGFRASIQEGEFIWGSNSSILQNAFILLMANKYNAKAAYQNAAFNQLHYILGRNPLSKCFVTGIGKNSPQKPYHPDSTFDAIPEPVPGLLVGGPNQFLNDSALKRSFSATSPPALVYLDSEESFSSNGPCITWNAALVLVLDFLTP